MSFGKFGDRQEPRSGYWRAGLSSAAPTGSPRGGTWSRTSPAPPDCAASTHSSSPPALPLPGPGRSRTHCPLERASRGAPLTGMRALSTARALARLPGNRSRGFPPAGPHPDGALGFQRPRLGPAPDRQAPPSSHRLSASLPASLTLDGLASAPGARARGAEAAGSAPPRGRARRRRGASRPGGRCGKSGTRAPSVRRGWGRAGICARLVARLRCATRGGARGPRGRAGRGDAAAAALAPGARPPRASPWGRGGRGRRVPPPGRLPGRRALAGCRAHLGSPVALKGTPPAPGSGRETLPASRCALSARRDPSAAPGAASGRGMG